MRRNFFLIFRVVRRGSRHLFGSVALLYNFLFLNILYSLFFLNTLYSLFLLNNSSSFSSTVVFSVFLLVLPIIKKFKVGRVYHAPVYLNGICAVISDGRTIFTSILISILKKYNSELFWSFSTCKTFSSLA